MNDGVRRVVIGCLALILGSGLASVYALDSVDFNNSGVVSPTTSQYENNGANNDSAIQILPKGIAISKTADATGVSTPTEAGDVINYTIQVDNLGLLPLTNILLTDSLIPGVDINFISGDINVNNVLDSDELWSYSASYAITQADIDTNGGGDGDIDNTASVVTDELSSVSDSAAVPITQAPLFVVTKLVDQPSIGGPVTLNYTIRVENTGNQTLTNIGLIDTLPDGTAGALTGPQSDVGLPGVLDVDEIWEYTVDYAVSQSEIDLGNTLTNSVSVTTLETGGTALVATADTGIVQTPQFTVAKSVTPTDISAPGTLSYQIDIVNTGNTTLSGIDVQDLLPDGSNATLIGPLSDTGTIGSLDVSETWTYTTTYTATQLDVDAGAGLVNQVNVTANETGVALIGASATTTVTQNPVLAVLKSVDLTNLTSPGPLAYVITVSNTGNVTLSNVLLADVLPNGTAATLTGPTVDSGVVGVLDVNETWEYLTSYTAVQSDIDAGAPLINHIDVQTDETGAAVFTANATTTIGQFPSMDVEKVVDQSVITAPTILNYTVSVENTGNVSLTSVNPTDQLPDSSVGVLLGPAIDTGLVGILDVGETWVYTTTYSATQSDVDSGVPLVNNVSVVSAEAGTVASAATTNVTQTPAIAITKTAVDTSFVRAGDTLNYAFVVQNIGNVGLTDIVITDPNADIGSLSCSQPMPFTLAVTDSATCTAQHVVTPADVLATSVTNQATVTSRDALSNLVTDLSDPVVVAMTQIPPVATDDSFSSVVSGVSVTLPGGANDTDDNFDINIASVFITDSSAADTDADGDADSLDVSGEGVWSVDNGTGEITFTPDAGFTADPMPIEYQIFDDTGLVSNVGLITVDYPQSAPVAADDVKINPGVPGPSNPTVVAVLEDNGNGIDVDSENDLNPLSIALAAADAIDTTGDGYKDTLTVAGEGTWVVGVATGEVTFTPSPGFLADPTPVSYTVDDNNGLTSNEALITVDYPQRAPNTVDDERLDQPLGEPVVIPVLANDTDPEGNIDPSTVSILNPADGLPLTELAVAGVGQWSVDPNSGDITFTAESGFVGSPEPIQYVVSDSTGLVSDPAMVSIVFEPPAALEGIVWLDANRDGEVGADESRKAGWSLHIVNELGVIVATTTTLADGSYSVTGLIPGSYSVEFYNELGVYMDSAFTRGPIEAGQVVNLPLPVDPGGVVYDSLTRIPVEGVTLALMNMNDQVIDASCLAQNQQNQVTTADGLYAFHLLPGVHPTCPENGSYRIELVNTPDAYHPYFSALIRQEGAAGCGGPLLACAFSAVFNAAVEEINCTVDTLPSTGSCEVQRQPDAPQTGEDTRYYVAFDIARGDSNIVFNHIPLDARDNDAEILISKSADRRQASIGDLVLYTVTLENTKEVSALSVTAIDEPPAGFGFVPASAQLIRTGPDELFDTADDIVVAIGSDGLRPVQFNEFDLDPEEIVRLRYVARVSTGVVAGSYVNLIYAQGPNGIASNEATATVEVISDPVLNQATLIGKVFHDRDEDGTQDSANATDLVLRSDYYGWNSLSLPSIPGRRSVNDDPTDTAVTVYMPIGARNQFAIRTREGTRISVDEQGTITEAHVGMKARGMSSQDIRVCTAQSTAVPTPRAGESSLAKVAPVLEIVLSNHGLNEEGVPGVRLATVTGLVIETDAFGRYSVPDVELGTDGLGRNFVLKVDAASLPDGARFTTENPYVLRIVNTTLNKINFGINYFEEDRFAQLTTNCTDAPSASQNLSIEVTLGSVFFNVGKADVRKDQLGIVRDIVAKLQQYGGGRIRISAHTDSAGSAAHNLELANRRAATIRRILRESLGTKLMKQVTIEVAPAASQEAD